MSYHTGRGGRMMNTSMSTPSSTTRRRTNVQSRTVRSNQAGNRALNTASRARLRTQRRREIVGLNRRRRVATSQATAQQNIQRRNLRSTVSAGPSARGRNASTQISRGYKQKQITGGRQGYATVRTGKGNYLQIVRKTGAALNRGQKGIRK
tara:strand:+ start:28 stop:480 length:453 start_codon:yes stop_codon:yes gene_type:complete